jgi:hypothetical protein
MTTTDTNGAEMDAVREGLALLADVLLPGTDTLPSGRQVGAHDHLLDQVLAADCALAAPVIAAGRRAGDAISLTLHDVQIWDAETREPAVFALTAAYYMSSAVYKALKIPLPGPRPIKQATEDEKYSEELLAPVRSRGAIYVGAPTRPVTDQGVDHP